jgi:hypothetical protein
LHQENKYIIMATEVNSWQPIRSTNKGKADYWTGNCVTL